MMVVYSDATGGDVTCSSKEALEWFNKGLIAYVAVRESSLPYFKAALQQDDSFVLAHCMLVCTCGRSHSLYEACIYCWYLL